jgi:hypothetical protein
MSEPISSPARPVSLITTLFVLVLFGLFFLVVRYFYHPSTTPPFVATPENLSKDLEWKATRDSRKETLQQVRKDTAEKANSYGWVDQKAGVVHLPIQRAMELTAQQYGRPPGGNVRDLPTDSGRTKF